MPQVCCVIGTRPEAIKMAPVIHRLGQLGDALQVRVAATGQHRGLLDQTLRSVGLVPDVDLDLMRDGQSLDALTARALTGLSDVFRADRPDWVLAQGDTTTVLAAALAAHYQGIRFAHVEAGLRTGRFDAPWPEESNRVLVSHLARLHFAPTTRAQTALLREGIDPETIHVTGNPVIDALRQILARPSNATPAAPTPSYLLVTTHRRENQGRPLLEICEAIRQLLRLRPELSALVPVHHNPQVASVLRRELGSRERIALVQPLAYPEFVGAMAAARLILTDSGGVQEEAPCLGVPVLVLRETTERQEALETPGVRIVPPRASGIVEAARSALGESLSMPTRSGPSPATRSSPFGDGWAAERIVRILALELGLDPGPVPQDFPGLEWTARAA